MPGFDAMCCPLCGHKKIHLHIASQSAFLGEPGTQ